MSSRLSAVLMFVTLVSPVRAEYNLEEDIVYGVMSILRCVE